MATSEHLVRWKFKANTLLNKSDKETSWYQQLHPDKESAVTHYISLLQNSATGDGIVVEIFRLTPLKEKP